MKRGLRALVPLVVVTVLASLPTVGQSSAAEPDADQVVYIDSEGWWHVPRSGQADYTFRVFDQFFEQMFPPPSVGIPYLGDWDGDGFDTPAITWTVGQTNSFSLVNSLPADGEEIDQPDMTVTISDWFLAQEATGLFFGDWNGAGEDTFGVYELGLENIALFGGVAAGDRETETNRFWFGIGSVIDNVGDIVLAGDWDGDGTDTLAVYRKQEAKFYYSNTNPPLPAGAVAPTDGEFWFGIVGDSPVVGDWDGDGIDTVGVIRGPTVYLRNSLDTGFADESFAIGEFTARVGHLDVP
jgi:hypothetical protein